MLSIALITLRRPRIIEEVKLPLTNPMTNPADIAPEQRELEALRRLASHVRSTYHDCAGVFSLRTHRIEQWSETGLPALLRTLDAVQGSRASDGRNWETRPEDDAGVFMLKGQRVKIVPVEPTERMIHDDNASDPPMLHPVGFLDADTLRYVYKQLLRVAPTLYLNEPDGTVQATSAPVRGTGAADAGRLTTLKQAIDEAEHKPGTWVKAVTEFGAIAARGQDLANVLTGGGGEKTFAHFSHKRDGWLATAAVNALPELLGIAELAQKLTSALAETDNGHPVVPDPALVAALREALTALDLPQ
jgi:hypothetical protein